MADPPPATAVGVIATAVLRALETPADGVRTETIGSYTRTATHDVGGLYLTERTRPPPSRRATTGAFRVWTVPNPPQASRSSLRWLVRSQRDNVESSHRGGLDGFGRPSFSLVSGFALGCHRPPPRAKPDYREREYLGAAAAQDHARDTY